MARRLQHDMTPPQPRSTVPWIVGGALAIVVLGMVTWSMSKNDTPRTNPVATSPQQPQPKGS